MAWPMSALDPGERNASIFGPSFVQVRAIQEPGSGRIAMNEKRNCWQVMGCGREPGGIHAADLGICPAAVAAKHDGTNGGKNAGRFCWFVAGTFCLNQVQGTFATKFENCLKCSFLRGVLKEEGESFVFMALGDHFYRLSQMLL